MYAFPKRWRWLTWGWFAVRPGLWRNPRVDDCDNLAREVAGYLPEIDVALREGRLGPHMRRTELPYYVPDAPPTEPH